jgi:hypothetical protein
MTTQTEMFPKTELDEATAVLNHLITEQEKAEKAADSAEQKSSDAGWRVVKQRHVVAKLQSMMPAAEPMVESDFFGDVEDAEILEIESDVLDPITGEVISKAGPTTGPLAEGLEPLAEEMLAELASEGVIVNEDDVRMTCPGCGGDGRIPDKTGGGHHGSCLRCGGSGWGDPFVLVAWPDNPDMQTTEVGPLTRYGELAADFLSSLKTGDPRREDSFLDYRIVDVDAGSERDPHAVIVVSDYGLSFSVEANHVPAAAESAA